MHSKRNRNRPSTPAWLDTLIAWLEIISILGTIAAGIYALVTMLSG